MASERRSGIRRAHPGLRLRRWPHVPAHAWQPARPATRGDNAICSEKILPRGVIDMNTMTETRNLAVAGRQKMTPSGGVRRDARRAGRQGRVRHRRLGVHGRARPVPARRHPLHLGRARAGRRAHGRRLRARVRAPRRVHRAERARASPTSSPSTAAAFWAHSPVVVVTPETGIDDARASAASRRPSSCRSSRRSRNIRRTSTTARGWRSSPAARSTARCSRWARRSSTFRATSSTATSSARFRGRSRSSAARAASRASTTAAELLAAREVSGDPLRRRRRDG